MNHYQKQEEKEQEAVDFLKKIIYPDLGGIIEERRNKAKRKINPDQLPF